MEDEPGGAAGEPGGLDRGKSGFHRLASKRQPLTSSAAVETT
jgi:hypothetical protein